MSEIENQYPDEFICPISHGLMINPIIIHHHGSSFTFDKNNIELWKSTVNGDNNPLTNVPGFREASYKEHLVLKNKIQKFIKDNNISLEEESYQDQYSINTNYNIKNTFNYINNENNNFINFINYDINNSIITPNVTNEINIENIYNNNINFNNNINNYINQSANLNFHESNPWNGNYINLEQS